MKKIFKINFALLLVLVFGSFFINPVFAEDIIPEEPTEVIEPEPAPAPTVTFIIRNGEAELWNGLVELPAEETISITDANNVPHSVNAKSVLAVLKSIDDTSETFSISNLPYFDSFSSFYLKCILPEGGSELCDNWQYAVGSFTPFSSIDTTILSGGETVGIYFGTSRQVVLSTNSITAGGSLEATAQKYDYATNVWNPLTGVNIGVTLPNPDDAWNPIVVSTHTVDTTGKAGISIADPNTYTLGIVEDFYFPSYTVTVSAAPSGGSGGGSPDPEFSVSDALDYLKSVQNSDGSFAGSGLYTDWAAIAYGAGNVSGSYKSSLLEYLSSNNSLSSLITDNERRAMALMALGENPYSFSSVNYIKSITDDFDGTQFGDADLVNDDIFALIPLESAGYGEDDDIITKAIAFILSEQKTNGSWEESVDITAAAIQALALFDSVDGVSGGLSKAENYLQNEQDNDGGWGNISSTSWAMQAEATLGSSWEKNGKSGIDYLAAQQDNAENNGGLLPSSENNENVIWATSYAIPAGLGKPWSEIMESFSKPKEEENEDSSSNNSNKEEVKTEIPVPPVVPPPAEIVPVVLNTPPPVTKKVATASPEKVEDTNEINSEEEEKEIEAPVLTATVANALPEENKPVGLPIILGTASGLILLYGAFKFFV